MKNSSGSIKINALRGMTLIEVMVALLIFAVTATSVMKAATEHLRGVGTIEDITFATWVANNRLTEVSLDEKWPPQNNIKGSEEMAGTTWYWKQKAVKTQEENMMSVEVSVSEDEAGENVVTTVSTFIAKPDPGSKNNRRGR